MALGIKGFEARDQCRHGRGVPGRRVREGSVNVAEDKAGASDPPREVGQVSPGQWPHRQFVEAEAPKQGGAVDHGQARVDRAGDVALVERERFLWTAALELEPRQVPGEM